MNKKPNCYECKHRRDLAGDCHSRCAHPVNGNGDVDPFSALMATLANVGRVDPVIGDTATELDIKGNEHGVRSGWFNWPFNFDPVWLESCNGFEGKKK
jgi:hypothetical protein